MIKPGYIARFCLTFGAGWMGGIVSWAYATGTLHSEASPIPAIVGLVILGGGAWALTIEISGR